MIDNMFHEKHGDYDLFAKAAEENPDLFQLSKKDTEYAVFEKQAEENVTPNTTKYGEFFVQKVIEKKIDHCWDCCPYINIPAGAPLKCGHPYFADKGLYAGRIINWNEDIENGFPSKCPLFLEVKK